MWFQLWRDGRGEVHLVEEGRDNRIADLEWEYVGRTFVALEVQGSGTPLSHG